MSKQTREFCDCCGREIPILGSRGDDHRVFRKRIRMFRWRFFRRALSWGVAEVEWQAICGDCWNAIGQAVREAHEQVAS